MPFQDDIMREFDKGVTEIENERSHKKERSPEAHPVSPGKKTSVAKSPDWLMEEFDAGVKEIEQEGIKETPLLPAIGRAVATIPPHIVRAGLGLVQMGAEHQKGEREEVRGALRTVRGVEPPKIKKETKPLTYDDGFGTFVLDLLGKGVEKVGEGIEAISETGPAKAYGKFKAKSRIAEAMVGGELKPEVMKLVKAGDKESLAKAAELLKGDSGFYQSWLSKKAEQGIAEPVAEAAMKGGKALGEVIEKIRPTTRRGSYKYFVTAAIEGVGSTMGPALAASIATKNPSVGMAIMFPQVFGEVYSEERVGGKGVHESSQKAMFYAASEVLSEGVPLGILTKPGGRLTTKIFKGASAEGIQEAVNEATQIAYDEGIIDEHTPTREIGRRLIEAGIIGAIGGGGLAVGAHAFTGKEEDAKDKLKKDVLDGIIETYGKGSMDATETIMSVMEGYKGGLLSDVDLDGLSEKYPELKKEIEAGKVIARAKIVGEQLSLAIDEGMTTGQLQGKEFTSSHAVVFIRNGLKNDIFTIEDIEGFKEKYPSLRGGLNTLLAVQVEEEIQQAYSPELAESLKDIALPPGQGFELVEPVEKEPFSPELAKDIKKKALPPGQGFELVKPKPEVKVRTKDLTYPKDKDYMAGEQAPDELPVEYKPILRKTVKGDIPWKTKAGAENAIKSEKFNNKGISLATHEVVETEGGYQIINIKEVKPEEAVSQIDLVKRYVEETGKKVEEGELDKVKERYPVEWAKIEKADTLKKELWDKLPEDFRYNRGINEYTAEELEAEVAEFEEAKEVKKIKPKTEDEARIAVEDAEVTGEILGELKEERRFTEEQKVRDDFYNKAAKKGNAAQASDIIGGGIDRLVDDIEKGRITQKKALSMFGDAVKKGITVQERFDEFKKKTAKAKPKELSASRIAERYTEIAERADRHMPFAIAIKNARALVDAISNGIYTDLLHPSNKVSRTIYAELTGEKLPKTLKGTEEAVARRATSRGTAIEAKAKEAEDPVPSLLSSKKKAGIKYEMEVMIAETGETATITKDAAVALRETKEDINKYNKFLECLI